MDPLTTQQLDQRLRQNWRQVKHQILDQFAQVSTADLDAAQTATDLIQRIADKSDYSERFVETRITELVGVGAQSSTQSYGQQQSYGQSGSPQGTTQAPAQGGRFGESG